MNKLPLTRVSDVRPAQHNKEAPQTVFHGQTPFIPISGPQELIEKILFIIILPYKLVYKSTQV